MKSCLFLVFILAAVVKCELESTPQCSNVIVGHKTHFEIHMLAHNLAHGLRNFEIDIPQPTMLCKPSHQTGLQVKVCDEEYAPQVLVYNYTRAVVHRIGDLDSDTTVKIVAFCRLEV